MSPIKRIEERKIKERYVVVQSGGMKQKKKSVRFGMNELERSALEMN